MAEGNEFWSPYKQRDEDDPLEMRLRQIEEGLLRSRDLKRVLVDPTTGEHIDETGLGTPGGTGGGSGGGGGIASHELLNDAYHTDTVTDEPVSQDLLVANADTPSKWERKAVGTTGYSLQVVGGLVAWATRVHNLLSAIHGDVSAAVCARGAVIVGNASSLWARVTAGAAGTYLGSDGTDTAFRQVQHSQLGGVGADDHHNRAHTLLNNASDHSDSDTGMTFATGDLIYRNSSGKWTRLAIGTAGYFLRVVAGIPAWVELAFSMITGTITATQHGNLSSTAGTTADHDGTLSANARVAIKKNGTLVATRRGINLIEGTNVTLTVTDDSGNEEVDVTIAQASVSAATVIVQEGDTTVVAAADTLDFAAADFDVTESPAGEANIAWHGFAVEEGNVEVSGAVKRLDFGAGFDVTESGGEAEVALDLSEAAGGDVTYVGNSGKVAKLNTVTLDLPTSPTPGAVISYVGGGSPQWEDTAPTAAKQLLRSNAANTGAEFATLDTVLASAATDPRIHAYPLWRRTDLSGVGALSEMLQYDGLTGGEYMPVAGVIVGVIVTASGDVGGVGDDYTVTVYKATSPSGAFSATSVTATISGGAGVERAAGDLSSLVSFNAGDFLTLYDVETGTLAAVGAKATLYVKFNV